MKTANNEPTQNIPFRVWEVQEYSRPRINTWYVCLSALLIDIDTVKMGQIYVEETSLDSIDIN